MHPLINMWAFVLGVVWLTHLYVPCCAVDEFVKHYGGSSWKDGKHGIPLSGGGWVLVGTDLEWSAGDEDA
jgi:hypothetical protein